MKYLGKLFGKIWPKFDNKNHAPGISSDAYSVKDLIAVDEQSQVHPEVAKLIRAIQQQLPPVCHRELDSTSLGLLDAAIYLHHHRVHQAKVALSYIEFKDEHIGTLIKQVDGLIKLYGSNLESPALTSRMNG